MRVSVKLHPLIKMVVLVWIIMDCAEISAQSETKSVTIQVGEQGPDGCRLLGQVKGSSNNSHVVEDDASYVDRLIRARNNLRSATQKLGGNTVHIIHSNNTGKYEIPGVSKKVVFIGNAYYCG